MKKSLILILIALTAVSGAFAIKGNYYEKGDTEFTLKAGITIPTFMFFYNDNTTDPLLGPEQMHSSIGGETAISYQAFVNQKWAVGGELGYNFAYSHAKQIFTTIPMTLKFTYVPVQTGTFDFNIHFNAGISLLKYDMNRYMTPAYASITFNPVYYFGSSWGLGIEAGLYSNAEIYTTKKRTDSCIAGFSPVVLTLTYRH